MQKVHHSIKINAPKKKVWETVIGKETYPEWTKAFSPEPGFESRMEGGWEEGSEVRFVATNEKGTVDGMVAVIAENRPYDFLSIKHVGEIHEGVEDRDSERVKAWIPAFENYTLTEDGGVTTFTVDVDSADEYKEMFDAMWPKALVKLKELAEKE